MREFALLLRADRTRPRRAVDTAQAAFNMALNYEFLLRTLVDGHGRPEG